MHQNLIESNPIPALATHDRVSHAREHFPAPMSMERASKPVLVIDENPMSRSLLEASFAYMGLPHITYTSIDTIVGAQIDLALAVVGPSSSQDNAVVAHIRRVDPAVCLQILLIGTMPVAEGMNRALTAGADDYLAFPWQSDMLCARTESLLVARFRSELALVQASERAMHLERALDSNRSIGIALGILMTTQKVTSEEAFICLKQASQRSNRKLREVAEDVIYTGALSEPA